MAEHLEVLVVEVAPEEEEQDNFLTDIMDMM